MWFVAIEPGHKKFRYETSKNKKDKIKKGLSKSATNDINKTAEKRVNRIISQGSKEVERVLPEILRGAIEDVYQTPLRLLENFGKQQLNKIKRNILP